MEVIFFNQAKNDIDFWKKSGQKQIMTRITNLLNDIKNHPDAQTASFISTSTAFKQTNLPFVVAGLDRPHGPTCHSKAIIKSSDDPIVTGISAILATTYFEICLFSHVFISLPDPGIYKLDIFGVFFNFYLEGLPV